jgi:hypothetical protein
MQDYYKAKYTYDYDDKRMRYDVTEWDNPINGVRLGKVVFYSDVMEECIAMAEEFNYNYKAGQEWELFINQECEFV